VDPGTDSDPADIMADDSLPVFLHPFAFLFTPLCLFTPLPCLASLSTTTISLPSFMSSYLYFLHPLPVFFAPVACLCVPLPLFTHLFLPAFFHPLVCLFTPPYLYFLHSLACLSLHTWLFNLHPLACLITPPLGCFKPMV